MLTVFGKIPILSFLCIGILPGCTNVPINEDSDQIVIRAGSSTESVIQDAQRHCSQYQKNARLKNVEDRWVSLVISYRTKVYYFDCV